jgi:hypothetical protein
MTIEPLKQSTSFWTDLQEWLTTVTVVWQEEYESGPFEFGALHRDGSLQAIIDSLLSIQAAIPEPYRADAMCAIDSTSGYEGCHSASIEVVYRRPATAEEINATKAKQVQRKQVELEQAQARYERLKLEACA